MDFGVFPYQAALVSAFDVVGIQRAAATLVLQVGHRVLSGHPLQGADGITGEHVGDFLGRHVVDVSVGSGFPLHDVALAHQSVFAGVGEVQACDAHAVQHVVDALAAFRRHGEHHRFPGKCFVGVKACENGFPALRQGFHDNQVFARNPLHGHRLRGGFRPGGGRFFHAVHVDFGNAEQAERQFTADPVGVLQVSGVVVQRPRAARLSRRDRILFQGCRAPLQAAFRPAVGRGHPADVQTAVFQEHGFPEGLVFHVFHFTQCRLFHPDGRQGQPLFHLLCLHTDAAGEEERKEEFFHILFCFVFIVGNRGNTL